MKPTCDNDCTQMGWIEAEAMIGSEDCHFSHARNVDLDGTFDAFSHDAQEMIRVNGWLMTDYNLVQGL